MESCAIESSDQANVIQTFWQQSDLNLSRGMDFQPRGPVYVRFTHLNHQDFKYKIIVNNTSNRKREGTVRIFLAPTYDERGDIWTYNNQRKCFIELDKFRIVCEYSRCTHYI